MSPPTVDRRAHATYSVNVRRGTRPVNSLEALDLSSYNKAIMGVASAALHFLTLSGCTGGTGGFESGRGIPRISNISN